MALKDLKSDLSKFRKPIVKPLSEKKRADVPKSSNQTPLSQFVDNAPTAAKSNTTAPKQGVTPTKFDNSSKFIGETDPNTFDNSSKFIGETDPNTFDNSSKFIGETTPSKMSLQERYLGQTETTSVQQGDKFKGETETANITQGDRFKGQTTPEDYPNVEKFKGETTPNTFKFVQNFLGETTSAKMSLESKFLGETDIPDTIIESPFKGETTPKLFNYNPKLDDQAKDPNFVDFITNEDAKGFSPYQQAKYPSQFTAVDKNQSKFDSMGSAYSDYKQSSNGISFASGYRQFKSSKTTGATQRYNPESLYEATYESIGDIMEQRNSPSFLDEMYHKFNLKDDSPNSLNLIKAPYILRGIQRKKISKGEPQFWDFGLGVDDGFIRGGIVASTVRAVTDTLRMGSFFLSVKGILWAVRQFGSQRTNKFGKLWTPVNLLATTLGQHIGFRPSRHGLIPGDESDQYEKQILAGYNDKLETMYKVDLFSGASSIIGLPFVSQTQVFGGADSTYGIGNTFTSRYLNTFFNNEKILGDTKAYQNRAIGGVNWDKFSIGQIEPHTFPYFTDVPARLQYENKVKKSLRTDKSGESTTLSLQTQENSQIPIDKVFEERGLYKSEGQTKGFGNDIKDYEALSYGTIAKLADGDRSHNGDFRALKKTKYNIGEAEEATTDYISDNFRTKYGFGQTFKTNSERISSDRLDIVNLLGPGDVEQDDIVKLVFKTSADNACQFRGTISAITETFSPTWNSEKPNGRADKMYMMTEFERTLSFNFQAVAYSRFELEPMWSKLKQLATFTMPFYGSSAGYRGRLIKFTIGDLYKDHEALLTSLSYTMSDEASWETQPTYTIPRLIDVSVGLTVVGSAVHSEKSTKTLYDYGA